MAVQFGLSATDSAAQIADKIFTDTWVKNVASTRDTDLRAHRVALTYHYFARVLDQRIKGNDSVWACLDGRKTPAVSNANWFNFGTWATVTINRDLRLRLTPAGTDRLLLTPFRRTLTPIVLHLRAADGQRVTRALTWGQRLVFLSTTLTFVRRWSGETMSTNVDKAAVFDEILGLATWDGMQCLGAQRHLQVIWDAFDLYHRAAESAARLRQADAGTLTAVGSRIAAVVARRIYQANLMITAVEQDVVNEAVGDVVDHLPRLLTSSVTSKMASWGERFLGVPRELTGLDLPFELEPTTEAVAAMWARFMTEQILVLVLPSETLRLGKDVPAREPSLPLFPPDLSNLTRLPGTTAADANDEKDNAALGRLVSTFDRSNGGGRGSGARDWRRYDDRMNWAVTMLRSRQQDSSLYWCPYSQEDQERIVAGKLPHRGGDPSDYEVEAPLQGLPGTTDSLGHGA